MKRALQTFKAFWSAEEVPRWFGFSLVVIYMFGLAAVARFGIDQARSETELLYESSIHYLVRDLVLRMGTAQSDGISDNKALISCRSELNDFAAHFPVQWLRIVDEQRRVVLSTRPSEVGDVAKPIPALAGSASHSDPAKGRIAPPQGGIVMRFPTETSNANDFLVRAAIGQTRGTGKTLRRAAALGREMLTDDGSAPKASDGAQSRLYLEGRLQMGSVKGSNLADRATTLTAVLVVFGALFGLYRRLRAHLRGMSRVAGRLTAMELRSPQVLGGRHQQGIEEDLTSLRIADVDDKVTSAWNQLVDFAQDLRDAANRQEANEELSRVLLRSGGGALAEALNAFPDGILYIVDEERFEYVNSTALRLFGWNARDVKQFTLTDAESNDIGTKTLALMREARSAEGTFEPKSAVLRADECDTVNQSSYRVWIVPLCPLRGGNGPSQCSHGCLVIVRDVSQQMRSERAREDFVAQVTHELRTPLTNIRAYAETLSSGMFDDPKVITECYNVITKETRRLSRLIEDILSVSQLEVGSIELHIDQVDLKRLLEEGLRDVRGLADEKKIDIQLQLPSKMGPIRADRDKLAVVVNNLLGNAIKYTPAGGEVLVGCQYSGETVLLTFKDNGIGIDSEDQGRIFEKFQRGGQAEVQDETGSGIGLYTAREIARRHGGEIDLISELGEGSTFMVRLPHTETRAAALTTAEPHLRTAEEA